MAEWYYSKNGQASGPCTEDEMNNLISNGEVTFVTLVWNEDIEKEGRGWVYAYDTDLSNFFTAEPDPADIPPIDQANTPEIPVPAPVEPPEPPAPAAPVYAEPSDGDDKKDMGRKKTPLVIKLSIVLFVFGLIIGTVAGSYIYYISPSLYKSGPVTLQTLPAISGKDTIVMKVSDMGMLRSLVSSLGPAISPAAPETSGNGSFLREIPPGIMASIDGFMDLFDAMDEMSVLAVVSQKPEIYFSFVEKSDALDIFMSRPGAFYSAAVWDDKPNGYPAGWKISLPFSENPFLYVVKRPMGKKSVVCAALTAEGINSMTEAAKNASLRFSAERMTSGDNYVRFDSPNGFTYRAIENALLRTIKPSDGKTALTDKVPWTNSEFSCTKNGSAWNGEIYSDFLTKNPELVENMPKIISEPKVYGDGNLAGFFAFDVGAMMDCFFSGSPDPVADAVGAFAGRQSALAAVSDGLKPVLEKSRISLACTEKNGHAQTAYMILETDASAALDSFYLMCAPFAAMLGGEPLKLDGWSSAMSIRIPFYGGGNVNIVFARKLGALLLGTGDSVNFSKSSAFSNEFKKFVSAENMVNLIVYPKLFDVMADFMNSVPSESAMDYTTDHTLRNNLTAFRNSFELLCGSISRTGRANGRLALTEGENPAGALLRLISQLALVNR